MSLNGTFTPVLQDEDIDSLCAQAHLVLSPDEKDLLARSSGKLLSLCLKLETLKLGPEDLERVRGLSVGPAQTGRMVAKINAGVSLEVDDYQAVAGPFVVPRFVER